MNDPKPDPELEKLLEKLRKMPTEEIKKNLIDLLKYPDIKRLQKAWTPRIYVTFTQGIQDASTDEQGVCRPAQVTFGPYLDVEISDDQMYVCAEAADPSEICEPFTLASWDFCGGWKVHDGTEEKSPNYAWVRFNQVPPVREGKP